MAPHRVQTRANTPSLTSFEFLNSQVSVNEKRWSVRRSNNKHSIFLFSWHLPWAIAFTCMGSAVHQLLMKGKCISPKRYIQACKSVMKENEIYRFPHWHGSHLQSFLLKWNHTIQSVLLFRLHLVAILAQVEQLHLLSVTVSVIWFRRTFDWLSRLF